MNTPLPELTAHMADYAHRVQAALSTAEWDRVCELAEAMRDCWANRRQVFLCGNGGSAANAMHLANDFIYGIARGSGVGLRAIALPSNSAVVTCLANDIGYDQIFSAQLEVQGNEGDILILLSGSGNSPNILKAIEQAGKMKIRTFAILGFSGGAAKKMADTAIHFPVDDMQISEDLQLMVGHMIMQRLASHPPQRA